MKYSYDVKKSDLFDINLPTRIQNALIKNGITSIKELKKTSNLTLSLCEGIGVRSIRVIKKDLSDYGKRPLVKYEYVENNSQSVNKAFDVLFDETLKKMPPNK